MEYNLYSDFARVKQAVGKKISIELINRPLTHPDVKVLGNAGAKDGEDGVVIYVGRHKQPYFIPLSFNNGAGNFVQSNEPKDVTGKSTPEVDRSQWINKLDFIDFKNLKYVVSYRNERDVNWCTPQFGQIIKNVCLDWEQYCSEGRAREKDNKNVAKIYPILILGYMSRQDGKLDNYGHVANTESVGHGHKTGRAIDMNFENKYDDTIYTDDNIIKAIKKLFDICKARGVSGIGYWLNSRYAGQLNNLYHPLSDHDDHFHVSGTGGSL